MFNPETDALTIIGNMFDWTVRVTTPTSDNYYALNANDITFTSYTDKHVMPRLE